MLQNTKKEKLTNKKNKNCFGLQKIFLNILLNKKFKRIEPEAVVLIEGSFLTKYTNGHAHQYAIQHNMHSNFCSCDLPTNAH